MPERLINQRRARRLWHLPQRRTRLLDLPESDLGPLLIEHSAWLYNQCHDNRDMMTASEREKATKSSQPLA